MTGTENAAAEIAPLIAAELANPDGLAVLIATVPSGTELVKDQAARDDLRGALEALTVQAPPVGA